MDLKSLIKGFSGGGGGGAVGSAVSAMNPLKSLAGAAGGGGFSGSSSSSMDAKNQISSGDRTVGGISYAPSQQSNVLMVGLVCAAVVGVFLVKKAK